MGGGGGGKRDFFFFLRSRETQSERERERVTGRQTDGVGGRGGLERKTVRKGIIHVQVSTMLVITTTPTHAKLINLPRNKHKRDDGSASTDAKCRHEKL